LNPNRNPDLTKKDIEDYLKRYTGVEKIIWLKEGIVNDHTDGHIDDFVKFVNPTTVICAYEDDQNDPNFAILDEAYQTLIRSTDQDERPFTIIKLPMPHVLYDDGTKAPASYVNFYIGNGVVLVPTFNDPNDAEALRIIGSLFLDRTVVGIDCSDIIYGGGAIHCITAQEPK
jgi:agmatine deiminase